MSIINKKYHLFTSLALIAGLLFTSCDSPKANEDQAEKDTDTTEVEQTQSKNESDMENTEEGTAIAFMGNTVHTVGKIPFTGTQLKDFTLTDNDLEEKTLADYKGQFLILNIFPSIDTKVCSQSVRTFNKDAANLDNTKILCISEDLPFAQKRFCGAEGIDNVVTLSSFRSDFGTDFGLEMTDGPLKGLLSRAVIVVNPEGEIVYTEQVPNIGQEPNYAAALEAVK